MKVILDCMVKRCGFISGPDYTIIALVPPEDHKYVGNDIEWPLMLLLDDDVSGQNPSGTGYTITIERCDANN